MNKQARDNAGPRRGNPPEDQEELGEDQDFISVAEADEIKSKNDPRRMRLTQDEWEMAFQVKRAFLQRENDLDFVSDYWCAQLAIICEDIATFDLEMAVDSAKHMQTFRQEFNVRDTLEEGCLAVQQFVRLVPQFLLHFCFSEGRGSYSCIHDVSGGNAAAVNATPQNFNGFMVGSYYVLQALTCDMECLRKRTSLLIDCKHVGWGNKNDFKIFKTFVGVLASHYPAKQSATHINVGVIFNMLFGIPKKVLRHVAGAKFEVKDSYIDDVCLRDVFLVPTVEAANRKVVASLQEALRKRYENQQRFSLY